MKSPSWRCPVLLCVFLVASLLIPTPGLSATTDQELPPAELTGGGRVGDGVSEGFGDILAPVFLFKSGLVFVNPRASYTDNSAEEYNVGVGYRHLLAPKNLILGANVYYDYRETSLESRCNQVGFGLEVLSDWVDARANYYLPEDDKETVNEYDTETVSHSSSTRDSGWGDPFATGNEIVQEKLTIKTFTTTTTKQHFEQFEEAMEGWDCELGVRLPIPVVMEYVDVKVFGGYYFFNSSFRDDDIQGFKGRLEIRALPAVYLDAEIYENKDVNGSDFYVGARIRVPFDVANISKGRNPFAGTVGGFMPSNKRAQFATRLTEMVMRDVQIRTEVSDVTEDMSKREESSVSHSTTQVSKYTLLANVSFVNGNNLGGAQDGTAEHPFSTIGAGVSNAFGNGVIYVYDAATPYTENVVLGEGQVIWGSGCVIQGLEGKTFGSGIPPVVDGASGGPTFQMANDTTIRGVHIINTEDITKPSQPFSRPEWGVVDIRRAGVFADNVNNLTLECNQVDAVQYGALLGMDGSFAVTMADNQFTGAEDGGVLIAGYGSSGTFLVDARGNTFSGNGGSGLEIMAGNYDLVNVSLLDNTANGNEDDGIFCFADNNGPVSVTVDQLVASGNGYDGLAVLAVSSDDVAPVSISVNNATLNDNDFSGAEAFAASIGGTSRVQIAFGNIEALRNFDDGVYADAVTLGDDSPIGITMSGIDANNQDADFGVQTFATAIGSGDVDMTFDQVNATNNGNGGIYADAEMVGTGGSLDLDFTGVTANDNVGDGFYAYAHTEHGSARVQFTGGIQANGNAGSGISVEAVEGDLTNGVASAVFDDVEADGNTGGGVWIGNVYCNAGDAFVDFSRVSASGNGDSGIQVDHVEGAGLDASTEASLSAVEANGNGGDGICFSDVFGPAGAAAVMADDVTASGNGGHGIYLRHVEAYGQNALALVRFDNVTADLNHGDGIYSYVVSHKGSAQADFSDIEANGNRTNGINVAYVNAQGAGASASASFVNVEASANSNRGIYAYVSSDDGAASAQFASVAANGNRGGGIYLDFVEAHGVGADADAEFTDVEASGNGADGIAAWAYAYGANGDASMSFLRTTTHDNRACGIYSEVDSENGDAYLTGERVVSYSNRQDGVQIFTYAASDVFADFGNGAQGSAGQCSIYSNTVFNMNNTSPDPISAQSNWWGSATPAPGKFNGNIDHANPLTSDPNP